MAVSASALTTLARLKTDLDITSTSEDTKLEGIIDDVSDMITGYLRRALVKAEVTEKYEGYGTHFMVLKRYPLDTSEDITVLYDTSTVSSDSYEVHNAGAGMLRRKWDPWVDTRARAVAIGQAPLAGSARKLYSITYTGGYVLPNDTSATQTLPKTIERACRLACVWLYRGGSRDPSIRSEKLMSWSATYAGVDEGSGLPSNVTSMLEYYRSRDL